MLYLVRHGTTTLNSRGAVQESGERIRGWLPVSLDEHGIDQAKHAAQILKDFNITYLYFSPLVRAVETAIEIAKELQCGMEAANGLSPWNIGSVSGMIIKDAIPTMSSYFETPLIDIPGGESYSSFYNRWKSYLYWLIDNSKQRNICAITHSRNLYSLEHILTNGKSSIVYTGRPIPGGIVELNPNSMERRIIEL